MCVHYYRVRSPLSRFFASFFPSFCVIESQRIYFIFTSFSLSCIPLTFKVTIFHLPWSSPVEEIGIALECLLWLLVTFTWHFLNREYKQGRLTCFVTTLWYAAISYFYANLFRLFCAFHQMRSCMFLIDIYRGWWFVPRKFSNPGNMHFSWLIIIICGMTTSFNILEQILKNPFFSFFPLWNKLVWEKFFTVWIEAEKRRYLSGLKFVIIIVILLFRTTLWVSRFIFWAKESLVSIKSLTWVKSFLA